jgi:UDP-N-acetylglucosamine 2-epimerase (non-hydrolysing)
MIDTLRLNLPRAVPAARSRRMPAGRLRGKRLCRTHVAPPVECRRRRHPERLLETAAQDQRARAGDLPGPSAHAGDDRTLRPVAPARPRGLLLLPPMGYLEMLGLMKDARVVLTDSGGIQEETTALGTPCITLRDNTERPITVDEGTNTIAGNDPAAILAAFEAVAMAAARPAGTAFLGWPRRRAHRGDRAGWLRNR